MQPTLQKWDGQTPNNTPFHKSLLSGSFGPMTAAPYSVVLVDDHQVLLDGLQAVLAGFPQWQVQAGVTSAEACLQQLEQDLPSLVVMDLQMPQMDGFALCAAVKDRWPSLPVLVLSMVSEGEEIRRALEAGANGYVLKQAPKEELVQAMETVAQGGTYHSPAASTAVMQSLHPTPEPRVGGIEVRLTRREKDVLRLIAGELSTPEIAEQLFISENTVETHRKNLMSKLQVRNLAGLVKYAIKEGLA